MMSNVAEIGEKFREAGIGLKDALAVIDMMLEDELKDLLAASPYDAFRGLNDLTYRTVHGTRVERFKPERGKQPFHVFEIHTDDGETLGFLNMIYLRKPLACYYLVYVEVLQPFRGRGLGNKILKAFREFVVAKGAVGLLDNIIPPEDPTYEIYSKLGWKRVEELIGNGPLNGEFNYMIYIPGSVNMPAMKEKLLKLLFNLRKKRPVIEMHDNEAMVRRTIKEFQSNYEALQCVFKAELVGGTTDPLMRFMFTRFVTKLLGFQRRIASLLGYTGGESLEQIAIAENIKSLPIQAYSQWRSPEEQVQIQGDQDIIRALPEELKKDPTQFVETLPIYRRPYLHSWVDINDDSDAPEWRISDLLELGFDPTKLREFQHKGADYIFERISPRFTHSVGKKMDFLARVDQRKRQMRVRGARIETNSPLAVLESRGNVYVLRQKVPGIHWDEALDQLKTSPRLRVMNEEAGIDRAVIRTVKDIKSCLADTFGAEHREEIEDLTYFVPWNLENNMPEVSVDASGVTVDIIWLA